MKKTLLLAIFVLFVVFASNVPLVRAQAGSMMGNQAGSTSTTPGNNMQVESVETVLQEILGQQKVSTIQQLDLSKISDDDWERLGDAVMEVQHPGQAHEVMDQMMGGEGSDSLRQMHINMGKAYLGYGGNYGSGMMSGGMMGNWNTNSSLRGGGFPMMGFGSMMGYAGNSGVYGIFGSVTWIALIIFLVAGTYFFIKQARKK